MPTRTKARGKAAAAGDPSAARSLTEEVSARLRDDILKCRLSPDARLRTIALCDEFGVSLAVVREALSRLAAEGLVVADPQRSFRVVPVSAKDLRDLTWMRMELESLALGEAIANGKVEWETGIVAAFHRLSRTPHFADPLTRTKHDDWALAHAQFHSALIGACDNIWLRQLRDVLFARSERYRRLSGLAENKERDVEGEHRRIMEATLDRDVAVATAELRQHLRKTADLVTETFWSDPVG